MNVNQNLTWEDIKAMNAETAQLIRENSQQIKETGQQIKETGQQIRETYQQIKETSQVIKEDAQLSKENYRVSKKNEKKIEKRKKESEQKWEKQKKESEQKWEKVRLEAEERSNRLDKKLEYLSELVGGIGNNNGDMAEEFFYNTLNRDKTFVNEKFDVVRKNITYKGEEDNHNKEYDIFMFNGTSAAVIEVKYNAKPKNISVEKLISRIDLFKAHYPAYKNHKIYLGVAAMAFRKSTAKELHSAGIATIHPVGKKMVVYDKTVKPF